MGKIIAAFASRGHTGFAAGDGELSKSAWVRSFVNISNQDNRKDADGGDIDGYDGRTWGVTGGVGGMVGEKSGSALASLMRTRTLMATAYRTTKPMSTAISSLCTAITPPIKIMPKAC